jgi:hypothetical protein
MIFLKEFISLKELVSLQLHQKLNHRDNYKSQKSVIIYNSCIYLYMIENCEMEDLRKINLSSVARLQPSRTAVEFLRFSKILSF